MSTNEQASQNGMNPQEEIALLKRQVTALKSVIRSIGNIKNKKIESPIYTLHPSYQQMRTFSYAEEIENPEVLEEVERKLQVHNEWKEDHP